MKARVVALVSTLIFASPAWAQPQAPDAAPTGPEVDAARARAVAETKRARTAAAQVVDRALAPQSGGLNAEKVARRAVNANPAITAKRAEVKAAAARVDQSLASFLPRLTLDATYTRVSPIDGGFGGGAIVGTLNPGQVTVGPCPAGGGQCVLDSQGVPAGAAAFAISKPPVNNYSLRAALNVPISDYLMSMNSSLRAARLSVRAAKLAEKSERRAARAEAVVAFYNWVRGQAQVAIAKHALSSLQQAERDTAVRQTAGTATRAEYLRVKALLASARTTVVEARAYEAIARDNLALQINSKKPGSIRLGEDVRGTPKPLPRAKSIDDLVAEAIRTRPDLAALRANRASLEAASKAADASKWPRLDGFGEYVYANPNRNSFTPNSSWGASWSVGATASWTFNDAFGASAQVRELKANVAGVRAQEALLRRAIRSEVSSAYFEHKKAWASLEAAVASEKAARESVRVARLLFRAGKSTVAQLLDAEHELVVAQLTLADARVGARVAKTQLAHAVGRDVARVN